MITKAVIACAAALVSACTGIEPQQGREACVTVAVPASDTKQSLIAEWVGFLPPTGRYARAHVDYSRDPSRTSPGLQSACRDVSSPQPEIAGRELSTEDQAELARKAESRLLRALAERG